MLPLRPVGGEREMALPFPSCGTGESGVVPVPCLDNTLELFLMVHDGRVNPEGMNTGHSMPLVINCKG